jgi:hypothetical protein
MRAKRSQMDSPLPSSKAAPSIWAEAAATPKTKVDGNGLEYVSISLCLS